MHVEWFGKRQYAFGLTWAESARRPGKAEIRDQRSRLNPAGRERFYSCVSHAHGHYTLGCGVSDATVRGAVYSYAATLAAMQPDGLYVAALDDEHLWFAVISGGRVAPETDVIDTSEHVLTRIEGYRSLLNLDPSSIFAEEGIYIEGGSESFDPQGAVAGAKKPVAVHAASGRVDLLPWAFAAGAVIAVIVGIKLYSAHKAAQSQQQLSAKQRQQIIQSYRVAVQGALSAYPQDPDWILRDWEKVRDALPPYFMGWTLNDIDCTPSGCDAQYRRDGNLTAYAVTPFTGRFGVGAVAIDPQGHAIKVHLPLQNTMVVVDDGLLRNPPHANQSLLDWLGLSPAHVAGLSEQPTSAVVNLAATNNGLQVGYPAFMTETVGFNGHSPVVVALPSIIAWAAHTGFHVTAIDFKAPYGSTGTTDAWAITLMRFHG